MAKLEGTTVISKSKMSQEIDAEELFGQDIPLSVKQEFAERAIETIINRTQSGKSIHGKNFVKYSEAYAEKKGVGVGDVDLTLNFDMLGSLADESSSKIKLSVDPSQAPKGFNHHVGDTLPRRAWFGITKSEAKSIADDLKSQISPDEDSGLTALDILRLASDDDAEQIRRAIRNFRLEVE